MRGGIFFPPFFVRGNEVLVFFTLINELMYGGGDNL